MKTPVPILEKIVDRLERRCGESKVNPYNDDEEDLVKKGREYHQDMEFAIDMLQTIIDVEKAEEEKENGVEL